MDTKGTRTDSDRCAEAASKGSRGVAPRRSEWRRPVGWQAIGTVALCLIGIVTASLVVGQFNQLRKQNEILARSVAVSYQPTGLFLAPGTQDSLLMARCDEAKRAETCLQIEYTLRNLGPGTMIYLGSISYWSTTQDDFRQRLMARQFGNTRFDGIDTADRGKVLLAWTLPGSPPGMSDCPVTVRWRHIDLQKSNDLFLHTLAIYADRDMNVYDSLRVLRMTRPRVTTREDGSYDVMYDVRSATDSFHSYSSKEVKRLAKAVSSQSHPLADYLYRLRREL